MAVECCFSLVTGLTVHHWGRYSVRCLVRRLARHLARHPARRPCHDRDDGDASLDRSSMVVPASQRSSRFRRGVLQDPTAWLAQVNVHALPLG